ncbi:MAG: DUF6666 family protein [Thermoguttaceae bacterium]
MRIARCGFGTVLLVMWASQAIWSQVALAGGTSTNEAGAFAVLEGTSTRAHWERRALSRSRPSMQLATTATRRIPRPWSPDRAGDPEDVAQADLAEELAEPVPGTPEPVPTPSPLEVLPGPGQIRSEPAPGLAGPRGPRPSGLEDGECEASCASDWCAEPWEGACGQPDCGWGCCRCCLAGLLRSISLFGGVQGFKGPMDRGLNGNFGFHEGLNLSGPLGGPYGIGYQLGFQAVHSNFSGYQTDRGDLNGRDQLFFTGGLFRRAVCGGLQGGAVFDFVHDNYYDKADLKQVRSETSIVLGGCHEVGYWGAYAVGHDRLATQEQDFELLEPNDIFAAFYRCRFGGGQGRIWGGATGNGEGILGADATVPLGGAWALEPSFTYLVPKHGPATGGQQQESWSIVLQLVWYPGRSSQCVLQNPFHPLFSMADNSVFLVRRKGN